MWPIRHRVAYNYICFELNFYNNKWSSTLCIQLKLKCSNDCFYGFFFFKKLYVYWYLYTSRKHACEKGQSMLSRITRIEHMYIIVMYFDDAFNTWQNMNSYDIKYSTIFNCKSSVSSAPNFVARNCSATAQCSMLNAQGDRQLIFLWSFLRIVTNLYRIRFFFASLFQRLSWYQWFDIHRNLKLKRSYSIKWPPMN